MNKENAVGTKNEAPTTRITRSRAKALGMSTGMLSSSRPSFKQEQKRTVRANAKRSASDEKKGTKVGNAGKQHKKRAVLKDVTNIFCENSYLNCVNATKAQVSARHSSQLTPFFIWGGCICHEVVVGYQLIFPAIQRSGAFYNMLCPFFKQLSALS